jgi:hypothetical protein
MAVETASMSERAFPIPKDWNPFSVEDTKLPWATRETEMRVSNCRARRLMDASRGNGRTCACADDATGIMVQVSLNVAKLVKIRSAAVPR